MSPSTDKLYGTPRVGGDALAWCTKCKMDLAHVIVAMIKHRPARVICKTCKSQHNYKLGTQTDLIRSTKAPRAKKTAAQKTYMKVSDMWEQKMAEAKGQPVAYKVTGIFSKGDVIQHPSFGMGLVEEVKGSKISVLFRGDEKTLVHGMTKPG